MDVWLRGSVTEALPSSTLGVQGCLGLDIRRQVGEDSVCACWRGTRRDSRGLAGGPGRFAPKNVPAEKESVLIVSYHFQIISEDYL